MGKNPKVLIVVALILALAVLGTIKTNNILVGVGIAVVGLLATVVVLRRSATGGTSRRGADGFLEAEDEMPRRTSTAQPLATWTPIVPSRPSTVDDSDDDVDAAIDDLESNWDDSSWSDGGWGSDTLTADDEVDSLAFDDGGGSFNGLGGLDTLDPETAFKPAVELEPLGFDGDGGDVIEVNFDTHSVNEDVADSDDIMAASQATELTGPADNSELARLLAKVQARLAAYE